MNITFNGKDIELQAPITLSEFLSDLGLLHQSGVAVAQNQILIRRSNWESTIIQDGDELEVLHATAGG